MTAPDETLTPDSSDDLAAELAFALRFQGRKPVEIIARVPHITIADRAGSGCCGQQQSASGRSGPTPNWKP
jgi:hypothetical protein